MPCPCYAPTMPFFSRPQHNTAVSRRPCCAVFRICLSHLIYTARPCLIHTCHAMPMPCSDHLSMAVLCCGLEKKGMVGARHGHGVASVNQIRPHCVNRMGKTNSNTIEARHGRGTEWARYGNGMLCVNRPLDVARTGNPHIHCHISNTAIVLSIVVSWDQQNNILSFISIKHQTFL